jgi:hypothetical protein
VIEKKEKCPRDEDRREREEKRPQKRAREPSIADTDEEDYADDVDFKKYSHDVQYIVIKRLLDVFDPGNDPFTVAHKVYHGTEDALRHLQPKYKLDATVIGGMLDQASAAMPRGSGSSSSTQRVDLRPRQSSTRSPSVPVHSQTKKRGRSTTPRRRKSVEKSRTTIGEAVVQVSVDAEERHLARDPSMREKVCDRFHWNCKS